MENLFLQHLTKGPLDAQFGARGFSTPQNSGACARQMIEIEGVYVYVRTYTMYYYVLL